MIQRLLYGPNYKSPTVISNFDHHMKMVRDKKRTKDWAQKTNILRWVASYITKRGKDADRVTDSTPIKKASLNFMGKFIWAIVCSRLIPTLADITFTSD